MSILKTVTTLETSKLLLKAGLEVANIEAGQVWYMYSQEVPHLIVSSHFWADIAALEKFKEIEQEKNFEGFTPAFTAFQIMEWAKDQGIIISIEWGKYNSYENGAWTGHTPGTAISDPNPAEAVAHTLLYHLAGKI